MATMQHLCENTMNFIIAHVPLCALALMVLAIIVTVAFDIMHNGATPRALWASMTRDKVVTAIMLLIVYSVCFLATSAFADIGAHLMLHA